MKLRKTFVRRSADLQVRRAVGLLVDVLCDKAILLAQLIKAAILPIAVIASPCDALCAYGDTEAFLTPLFPFRRVV